LDKAAIGCEPFDFLDGQIGILNREQDRSAQARITVEQFLDGPVVDGRAQNRGHVLVEQRDRAMQDIADRNLRSEPVQRLAAQRRDVTAGKPRFRTPVGSAARRRIGRIAGEGERISVDVTIEKLIVPVFREVGQQRGGRRHRWMDVAIDRAGRNFHGGVMLNWRSGVNGGKIDADIPGSRCRPIPP
jgi:hypothetical protein